MLSSNSVVHHEGGGGLIAEPGTGVNVRWVASPGRCESASVTWVICAGASSPNSLHALAKPQKPGCSSAQSRPTGLGYRDDGAIVIRHVRTQSTQVPQIPGVCAAGRLLTGAYPRRRRKLDRARPLAMTRSGNLRGHAILAYGYQAGLTGGVPAWVPGTIVDRTERGWLQLGIGEDAGGLRIRAGLSGTPVWGAQIGQVMGLVARASMSRNVRLAFAVSGETVFDAWPDLRESFLGAYPFRGLMPFQASDGGPLLRPRRAHCQRPTAVSSGSERHTSPPGVPVGDLPKILHKPASSPSRK